MSLEETSWRWVGMREMERRMAPRGVLEKRTPLPALGREEWAEGGSRDL